MDAKEFICILGIIIGAVLGISISIGSICALTYENPKGPDWLGFFVTLAIGLILILIAYLSWGALFGN
jgi:hypothetical protein